MLPTESVWPSSPPHEYRRSKARRPSSAASRNWRASGRFRRSRTECGSRHSVRNLLDLMKARGLSAVTCLEKSGRGWTWVTWGGWAVWHAARIPNDGHNKRIRQERHREPSAFISLFRAYIAAAGGAQQFSALLASSECRRANTDRGRNRLAVVGDPPAASSPARSARSRISRPDDPFYAR